MRRSACFALLGLLAHLGRCQLPPGLAGMATGMSGMTPGMGGTMPDSIQDYMLMQALSGGSGGSGGSGAGGGGATDPALMMMLAQQGGLSGTSSMSEILPMMMLMRNNQPDGNPAAGGPGASRGAGGPGGAARARSLAAAGGNNQNEQGFPSSIANMLGNSGSGITPSQQSSLFTMVQMAGGMQRIMDAVTSPTDRIQLERDGLPGIRPMVQMMMCPRPNNCQFPLCESTEIPFTPESFYTCRGCPRCRLDSSTRTMMNMMSQMQGGTGGQGQQGGTDPLQQMMMMQALQGQGGQIPPALLMAMMSEQATSSQAAQTNEIATSSAQPQSIQMRLKKILPQLNRNQAQLLPAAQPALPQLPAATQMPQQLPLQQQMTSQIQPQVAPQTQPQLTSQFQAQQLTPQQSAMLQQQLQIQQIQMQQMKRKLEQQTQLLQQQQQQQETQPQQGQTVEYTQQPAQTQWTPPAGFPTSVPEPTAQTEIEATPALAENKQAEGKPTQISKPIPRPPPEFIAAMRAMGEKMRAQRKAINSGSVSQAQQ